MPYASDQMGVYKIVNTATGGCYVGQATWLKKRRAEHFRLLRLGAHPNPRLQNSFRKHGADKFVFEVVATFTDHGDMDVLENAFISGDAVPEHRVMYNVAAFAKAPMRGRRHTEVSKRRISEARKVAAGSARLKSEEYRASLRDGQRRHLFSDRAFVEKLRFILDNQHLSYAERGRQLAAMGHRGADTGSVRKNALKYSSLKGDI